MLAKHLSVVFVSFCALMPGLCVQAALPDCYTCVDPFFQSPLIDNDGGPWLIVEATNPNDPESMPPTCMGGKDKWTTTRLHSTADERCVEIIYDFAEFFGARGLMSVANIKKAFKVDNVPDSGSMGTLEMVAPGNDPDVKLRVCNSQLCNGSLGLRTSGLLAIVLPALLAVLRLFG